MPKVLARLSRGIARQAVLNLSVNALVLLCSVGTATVLARGLGPSGRGEVAAILVAPGVLATLFAMGSNQAVTFEQARDPNAHKWLFSTWVLVLVPCAVAAVLTGELLIGVLLRDQTGQVRLLAALYMPVAAFLIIGDLALSVLVGDHDFTYFNIQRLAQPLLILAGYLLFASLGRLGVSAAIFVSFAVYAAADIYTTVTVLRRYGWGAPSWRRGKANIWYGLRAHGTNVSQLVSLRVDQLILPAFVGATSLGFYASAVSASNFVFGLAAPLATLVLPIAARRRSGQAEVVRRATQAAFVIAAAIGGVLALCAEFVVRVLYGKEFLVSVGLVRLLVPGVVFYAVGFTIWQGLYAVGRPGSAAAAQFCGFAVTIAGLVILLPRGGGIVAAAIVSSSAYAAVAVLSLVLFCRATGVPPGSFLDPRGSRSRPHQAEDVRSSPSGREVILDHGETHHK